MKACPKCERRFEEGGFCAVDGTTLVAHEMVPGHDDPLVGQLLSDRYFVSRIVADGGMGRVYEGLDRQVTDTRVAIKVLHADIAVDPVAVERFRREFQISNELQSPYIVKVMDFQQTSVQRSALVMEFLDGEELRQTLIRESRIEPARLIRIFSQVAIALDVAHERQYVHRDLKPENIFLCRNSAGDNAKLLDFGSARVNKNRAQSKLTNLGTTLGSPYYMSPEQAEGSEDLDGRADVFALGAMLYECLTGVVPFNGPSAPLILLAILTKSPPPLSTLGLGLPPALDDVLDDALAKKPATRTQTVGAFVDSMGHAFGLEGSHFDWANQSVDAIASQFKAVAAPARQVNADPFAQGVAVSDPFAAPPPAADPRFAMDVAFQQQAEANFGDTDAPGTRRTPWLWVGVGAAIVVVIVVLIIVFASK